MVSSADFKVSLPRVDGASAPLIALEEGTPTADAVSNGCRVGQIPWPPAGSFHDRQRAVSWPSMGSFSWPPTHVEFFNRFIDELGEDPSDGGVPPYVAPHYQPHEAMILVLAQDPGPMAGGARGSGFLSYENNDESAKRMECFLRAAGIDPDRTFPWNAYPWYVHETGRSVRLSEQRIERGIGPLLHVIEHLPTLRAVVGFGKFAEQSLVALNARHGDYLATRGVRCLSTYHSSPQAVASRQPSPELEKAERRRREQHIVDTLLKAAADASSPVERSPSPLRGAPSDSRPAPETTTATTADAPRDLGPAARVASSRTVVVPGRPTGYAGGRREREWKAAVAEAFSGFAVPANARVSARFDFRLAPEQTLRNAPDLDNLIKSSIDALTDVLGRRNWLGSAQADDERIDAIHARKRLAGPDESPGATITLSVMRAKPI